MNKDKFIISGEYVVIRPDKKPIQNGAVVVDGDTIVEIGPFENIIKKFDDFRQIKRPSGLVMPGLINAHTHGPMVLLRGIADDLPLKEWLERHIFPAEARLDPELIALGTELACAEMIRSGTTSFVDMYFFEDTIAHVVDTVGLRAWLGEGVFDFPSPAFPSGHEALEETVKLADRWKNHSNITITVDPHTPYTCGFQLLEGVIEVSRKHNLLIVIHLAETKWEVEEIKSIHGCTPVEYLDNLGLLDSNTITVHCVWLEERDVQILKDRGVSVVHCPESNLKLGSGIAPIKFLLKAGINVALGTDGAASNNDLDMLCEMDFAAKLPKGILEDPAAVSAKDAFSMATINAARALGREDLGVLVPGSKADIAVIDLNKPSLRPCFNPISQIVYAAKGSDVTDVFVGGKILMEDGVLQTIDEDRLLNRIKEIKPSFLS